MPGPCLDNLITEYVDTIPTFPNTVTSGNSAFGHYLLKHRFTDISLFNNSRFAHQIRKFARDPLEEHNLWMIANKVNIKAQKAFESGSSA